MQLFREIDEICKKHNLRYVMAGGTLIGVLRNEGFIPWDDDVDIYMPKSDWDKFVEICKTERSTVLMWTGRIRMDFHVMQAQTAVLSTSIRLLERIRLGRS